MTLINSRTNNDNNILVLKYPAAWWKSKWREALPAGNGRIGAAVYGAVQHETIMINHSDLWHGGQADPLPDVSRTLSETRKLMDEGRYQEASWNLTHALKETGYASRLSSPLPLVDLKVTMSVEQAFRQYRRSLNMETGEVMVSWKDGETAYARSLFVSRANDCIVYSIRSDQPLMEALLQFAVHPSDNPGRAAKIAEIKETVESFTENEYLYYAAKHENGSDYGAVLRVIAANHSAEEAALKISQTDQALILVKVFTQGERVQEWSRLKKELSSIKGDYDQLLEDHVKLHGALFSATKLELGSHADDRSNEELLLASYDGEAPVALLEKLWAFGRYLYISSTHEDGLPMPLYGLWGGDYRLMWCHYMANENIQMMNWHAPVGGLTRLMRALFRHYGSLMDTFRDNAQKLYGCRGIFIPAGTTPGIGRPTQIVPVILNWTGAAGWLARHYYEYYLFTGDRTFLIEEALPFMKEAALFYEDFLIEGEDGQLQIKPSVSPENTPANHMPDQGESMDHPMPTTINATMDIAIIKELFTNLIEGSRSTSMYLKEIPKWEDMLRRIPAYQVNEEGAVKEWTHEGFTDRYNHRHLSHIYPIFPGQEFAREEEPELFEAFETAVNKRLIGAQTGWSMAHMAAIYARLGDGEKAIEALDILSRTCLLNNFFTLHNDWRDMGVSMNKSQAPVQLDANVGLTNAIQEMLIYVSPRIVKLMPAVPSRFSTGKVEGLRFCTGSVSYSWDRAAGRFEAELSAERGTDLTLILPDEFAAYELSGEGDIQFYESDHQGTYHIRLEPKQKVQIRSRMAAK